MDFRSSRFIYPNDGISSIPFSGVIRIEPKHPVTPVGDVLQILHCALVLVVPGITQNDDGGILMDGSPSSWMVFP